MESPVPQPAGWRPLVVAPLVGGALWLTLWAALTFGVVATLVALLLGAAGATGGMLTWRWSADRRDSREARPPAPSRAPPGRHRPGVLRLNPYAFRRLPSLGYQPLRYATAPGPSVRRPLDADRMARRFLGMP